MYDTRQVEIARQIYYYRTHCYFVRACLVVCSCMACARRARTFPISCVYARTRLARRAWRQRRAFRRSCRPGCSAYARAMAKAGLVQRIWPRRYRGSARCLPKGQREVSKRDHGGRIGRIRRKKRYSRTRLQRINTVDVENICERVESRQREPYVAA